MFRPANKFSGIFRHRFGPVAVLLMLVCLIGFITRVVLTIVAAPGGGIGIVQLIPIFSIGFFYDAVVAFFFAIPVAIFCWLIKDNWYKRKWVFILLLSLFTIISFILVFSAVGEVIFWQEYGTRYNFIAVDYLIYTTEVIGNIRESYNMPLIMTGILLIALVFVLLFSTFLSASRYGSMHLAKRSRWLMIILMIATCGYFFVNNRIKNFSGNSFANQLAGNGIYEFGAAFWHNEIDYLQFYQQSENIENFRILKALLAQKNATFNSNNPGIDRTIHPDSAEKKYNIILISVESLSGDYLRYFGNTQNITPYIDSLIPHSLFFSRFYATGTRTVRGLEALSLSIPPTPGQSIVRRPNNENLFTIGNLLKQKGYDVNYVYGGNSFFDNMGYFFRHNGYRVIDQADIPENIIHHKTVWGVADEDAFTILMQECDKSFDLKKPFFNHLMTVSNHRPYTYPNGRIDIPGDAKRREGAVKYTDWCINHFITSARSKPWFNNTIFVVVADHCSRSAGKTDLPVNRYHIPCLVYAPNIIQPKIENRLTSQIDLIPTILGFLNLHYQSKFFGKDMYQTDSTTDRAFISTYQNLGYIKSDTLTILYPQKKLASFSINFVNGDAVSISPGPRLSKEAIAWYQSSSFLFKNGGYKMSSKQP